MVNSGIIFIHGKCLGKQYEFNSKSFYNFSILQADYPTAVNCVVSCNFKLTL